MKRLLLVHYHFPPIHSVAVKQALGYCKYLPEFGWEVHVLSKNWGEKIEPVDEGWGLSFVSGLTDDFKIPPTIHRAASAPIDGKWHRLHHWLKGQTDGSRGSMARALAPLRKLVSLFEPFYGAYPDRFVGWSEPARQVGRQVIRDHRIDALLSISPPETNHLVASRLASEFRLPWLPIFGDLYGYFIDPRDWHGNAWRRFLALRLRRQWLSFSNRLMAVSPYMCRYLEERYGKAAEVVVVGFDTEKYPEAPVPRNAHFLLSHSGSIYLGDQRPELLFDALDEFLRRFPKAAEETEVRLVGSRCESELEKMVQGRPCARVVRIETKIPPEQATELQRGSDLLILLNTTALRDKHGTLSYPAKIFDYFGARRPVLALPSDRDWTESLLKETGAGISADSAEKAADEIGEQYLQWKKSGQTLYSGRPDQINRYSCREQARRIADVLNASAGP